jgi:hypothetical protein
MKTLFKGLLALGGVGIFLAILTAFGMFAATIYGLYLAFSASIILGIVVLFVEPMPLIIGLCALLAHKDLAQMIVDALHK